MRYLTKEWYEQCQQTGLHFGKRSHKGAYIHDDELYRRLYKRKEKAFVQLEREMYDIDPRYMLKQDGAPLVPLSKVLNGEEISEADLIVFEMPPEQREHIHQLIAAFDVRPPFDESGSQAEFRSRHEWQCESAFHSLPAELSSRIADKRLFALGYCTNEILTELKKLSKENERKIRRVMDECNKVRQGEDIPDSIAHTFGFHDCKVTELVVNKNIVMRLDTKGGFTSLNKVTFKDAQIIKQDQYIEGSHWLYEELYKVDSGYEAHMLFSGEKMADLIIRCSDIVMEQE
ncbi:hypothetical protein A7K91_16025 [Paenibacillus oryzae]|uniref:DUF4085 domain-containing protein n=1 Tax=Paenibacillus oryzae TaxID=1844972 RepID=A0A1A5YFF2_9BACL|nr:DUF4085 family protein [Paenibacillus oryzae]OBR64125.1 hypothetical protein A7K91_16025 [Paenibacillus oryzae]